MKILTAEYVLPISSEPISNGTVVIDGDKIVDVGRTADLTAIHPDAELIDFGM